jgi:hypothetical protein
MNFSEVHYAVAIVRWENFHLRMFITRKMKCIVGFDMNSLYPTAMLHPMPLCDFEWISGEDGEKILRDMSYNWLESETGY